MPPQVTCASWIAFSLVLTETCLFYLDNITVFSKTSEENLEQLEGVFQSLRGAKLKLCTSKCTLAAPEVSYLGHCRTWASLYPNPGLLRAIRDILTPQNVKEVRSILGLATYYRRYVKGFATVPASMHTLTKKDVIFHWIPECQEAFVKLKHLLTIAPNTAFPDFSLPFCLYTDASMQGLGAILAQVQERQERIIC